MIFMADGNETGRHCAFRFCCISKNTDIAGDAAFAAVGNISSRSTVAHVMSDNGKKFLFFAVPS